MKEIPESLKEKSTDTSFEINQCLKYMAFISITSKLSSLIDCHILGNLIFICKIYGDKNDTR